MTEKNTIIIGGGAAGLFCALRLKGDVTVLERGARVGRKLSATGNGQGNLTNLFMDESAYFPVENRDFVRQKLEKFGKDALIEWFESMGGMVTSDERGRVYPSSRQASSVTDLMRFTLAAQNKQVVVDCFVESVVKEGKTYVVRCDVKGEKRVFKAKNVVICCGGMAAKNFGSDGNGYALARSLGHTLTPLFPSLVQLKTDVSDIKTLKGQRVKCDVKAFVGKQFTPVVSGDVIFTEYGLSGDAIFRLSALISGKEEGGAKIYLDLMPGVEERELEGALEVKMRQKATPREELFCGVLANQVGRAVLKKAAAEGISPARCAKNFTVTVRGTLGYDYAQVTKGGIPISEIADNMESKRHKGLYFAGEIVDVDGQCGGYNLQWAFTSASVVAESIDNGR